MGYNGVGHPSEDTLWFDVRGQLPVIEHLRVVNHVARCVECATKVLALRQEPEVRKKVLPRHA